jgi:hypothetical protein
MEVSGQLHALAALPVGKETSDVKFHIMIIFPSYSGVI